MFFLNICTAKRRNVQHIVEKWYLKRAVDKSRGGSASPGSCPTKKASHLREAFSLICITIQTQPRRPLLMAARTACRRLMREAPGVLAGCTARFKGSARRGVLRSPAVVALLRAVGELIPVVRSVNECKL